MPLYGHLVSAMQVLSFSGARAADATMAAPAWIPHSAPLGLPLAPLLAEPFQPLVLGVLLAAGVGLSLPCGALVVLAQAIGLTINWHLCRGVLLLLLARGVSRQLRRSATDFGGSC